MKHQRTLVILPLIAAASVFAQKAPAAKPVPQAPVGFGASHRFETSLSVLAGSISNPAYSGSEFGVVLDAQVFLPRVFFLSAGYRDFSDIAQSTNFGLGVAIGAGNSRITLGLNLAVLDFEGMSGEWQTKLSAAYEYRFANGLFIGGTVAGFVNSNMIGNSTYAVALNAGWKFDNGFSLNFMAAHNDMILGVLDGGESFTAGLKYTF